jgi:hypothetical protein
MAGIIFLQNQGVYQFTTARNSTDTISLIAGTDAPFRQDFYGGITAHTRSLFASADTPNPVTIDNHGIYLNRGLVQYKMGYDRTQHPYINSDTVVTSSITSYDQLLISGSLYVISGSGDHHFILPSTSELSNKPGVVVKIFKNSGDANLITINPNGTGKINNALTKSCSDPYCSVELISMHSNPGWAIVSAIGTWT